MISTTLYLAGSAKKSVDSWVQETGRSRLMSQLNDRTIIKRWKAFKEDGHPNTKIMIDSGAFSAYSQGKTIDVDEYVDWLNENGDAFDVMVQVDYIPGKSNQETDAGVYIDAPRISWENFLHMRSRLRPELLPRFIPVFHQGEDWKWLDNMLNWTDPETGKHLDYIGISPHTEVTSANRLLFCKEVFKHIRQSSNPTVKQHAFGMTALQLLQYAPFTSVDSTTWLQCAVHGTILLEKNGKLTPVMVSERTLHIDSHFVYQAKEVQDAIVKQIQAIGWDTEALIELNSKALPKSQRVAAAEIDDEEDAVVNENLTNAISERQKFNAASMQHFLDTHDFLGFPKSVRRIGR